MTSPAHRVDLAGTEGFPLIFTGTLPSYSQACPLYGCIPPEPPPHAARNTGSGTIHMLNRMTPFEGLLDDL